MTITISLDWLFLGNLFILFGSLYAMIYFGTSFFVAWLYAGMFYPRYLGLTIAAIIVIITSALNILT